MLFGGSGGQNFFERATWVMGALFICGALGLTILKSRTQSASILEGEIVAPEQIKATTSQQQQPAAPVDAEQEEERE